MGIRRIALLVAAAALSGIPGCSGSHSGGALPFGADANLTGSPVGGGEGYQRVLTSGDYTVGTRDELLAALGLALPGQVVFVRDDAVIDLTGLQNVVIPAGVTLASGRGGSGGSPGALIFSTALETFPLFKTGGNGVRVTGLRIQGPDPERRSSAYELPNSRGIQTSHANLEVDNCELWAWSHAAVCVFGTASRGAGRAYIHHNSIHHCQRSGLGYGVVHTATESLIEANLFDWNRHHIAGTGEPLSGYEARYNVCRENANSHNFDMHGGADRGDGTDIAGDWITIHHNTFHASSVWPVVIRGIPQIGAQVHDNWFVNRSTGYAVHQSNAYGNLAVFQNAYGAGQTVVASEEAHR